MSLFYDIESIKEHFQKSNLEILINFNTLESYIIENDILFSYLGINDEFDKKYILLSGPEENMKLLVYPSNNIDLKFNLTIWNWNLVFIYISENYLLINNEKKYDKYTPLEWIFNIFSKNINWSRFNKILQNNKRMNKIDLKKSLRKKSMDLGLRLILTRKDDNLCREIISELDGKYVYSFDIENSLSTIYSNILSLSKRGNNLYVLFSYQDITKDNIGYSINGYSLTELLEYGLVDKLNELVKTENPKFNIEVVPRNTENFSDRNINDILITWY